MWLQDTEIVKIPRTHECNKQIQQRNDFSSQLSKTFFQASYLCVSQEGPGPHSAPVLNLFCFTCLTGICSTFSFAFASWVCMFVLLHRACGCSISLLHLPVAVLGTRALVCHHALYMRASHHAWCHTATETKTQNQTSLRR